MRALQAAPWWLVALAGLGAGETAVIVVAYLGLWLGWW